MKPMFLNHAAYSVNADVPLGQRLTRSLATARLFGALGILAAAVQRRSRAETKRPLRL
jgi:hypothetical protein